MSTLWHPKNTRLLCPWGFPGKNTRVSCHFLLQNSNMKSESCSVLSDSMRPHGLCSPWNPSGQNTGVGSLFILQGIFPTQGSNPGILHCRQPLHHLSQKGSPYMCHMYIHIYTNYIIYWLYCLYHLFLFSPIISSTILPSSSPLVFTKILRMLLFWS